MADCGLDGGGEGRPAGRGNDELCGRGDDRSELDRSLPSKFLLNRRQCPQLATEQSSLTSNSLFSTLRPSLASLTTLEPSSGCGYHDSPDSTLPTLPPQPSIVSPVPFALNFGQNDSTSRVWFPSWTERFAHPPASFSVAHEPGREASRSCDLHQPDSDPSVRE